MRSWNLTRITEKSCTLLKNKRLIFLHSYPQGAPKVPSSQQVPTGCSGSLQAVAWLCHFGSSSSMWTSHGTWVVLRYSRILGDIEDLLSVPSPCEVTLVPLCHSWPPTTTANLWPTYSGQEHLVSAGSDADTLPRSGTCGGPVNWSPPIADSSSLGPSKGCPPFPGQVRQW